MAKDKVLTEDGTLEDVPVKKEVEVPVITATKTEIKKKNYNFQLVGRFFATSSTRPPFPPSFQIPSEDIVFDEETGRERHIRYLEGIPSIYVDEQDVSHEMIMRLKKDIVFSDGHLRVPYTNPTLIEYLTKCNWYDRCSNRMPGKVAQFKLLDYEAMEAAEAEKNKTKMEAMKQAFTTTDDKMIPHAKYLGVSFLNPDGSERTIDSIRNSYVKAAEANPAFFLKTFGNPLVNAKYSIDLGIERGIIVGHIVKGQAHWGKTKALITIIPAGRNVAEYLAEYAMTKKGEDFYAQLKDMLAV